MKRSPLRRSSKPLRRTLLRPRGRPRRGILRDALYIAWQHTQQCVCHPHGCPLWAVKGGLLNRLEVHHIDHNRRNDYRTVPICSYEHKYAMPRYGGLSRAELEAHVARLQGIYSTLTGRAVPSAKSCGNSTT